MIYYQAVPVGLELTIQVTILKKKCLYLPRGLTSVSSVQKSDVFPENPLVLAGVSVLLGSIKVQKLCPIMVNNTIAGKAPAQIKFHKTSVVLEAGIL